MSLKAILEITKQTWKDFSEDKVPRLGAALAYYSIFSLAPLLILAIGIAGLVFHDKARDQILGQIGGTVGEPVAGALAEVLQNAGTGGTGLIATVVGIVVLIFGASGLFVALQDALNTIWHVTPKPDRGWWTVLQERFLSFGMVLGIGFLLLVSLILSAAISALSNFLTPASMPGSAALWQALNTILSLAVITVLLALIYKILPDVKLGWENIWISAFVTAILFSIGKYLIGLYLAHTSTASAFGAAGSLVIILIWVYYSSQILLFGAELCRTLRKRSGKEIVPTDNAILLTDESAASQGMPSHDHLDRRGQASVPARQAG
jgi:membrane protein